MKQLYVITLCLVVLSIPIRNLNAEDVFPEFETSLIRVYIPIEKIRTGYQEDLEHEVGFNFSYNLNGQLFSESGQGHIQTRTEGFSGVTDKSTPWKILTELLGAYQNADIDAIKTLYTPDSHADIDEFVSDPEIRVKFMNFMSSIAGMDVLIGFYHKDGFISMVNVSYHDNPSKELMTFYFVQRGTEYRLNKITLDEGITGNLSVFLAMGYSVAELAAPKHRLSVEKKGRGDGTVQGSGIDCGEVCIEVYVAGTAVWLKAAADQYSTFEGWLVDDEPLRDRLVIKEDTTVTAVFEKIPPKGYTLTIEKIGTGEGLVSDSEMACEAADCLEFSTLYADETEAPLVESGVDCGEACSATYIEGTTVRLKAVAAEGSEFVEWLVNGEALIANPEITEDLTITAVFDAVLPPEEEQLEEEEEPEPSQSEEP